jgi:hypothetical protein
MRKGEEQEEERKRKGKKRLDQDGGVIKSIEG